MTFALQFPDYVEFGDVLSLIAIFALSFTPAAGLGPLLSFSARGGISLPAPRRR